MSFRDYLQKKYGGGGEKNNTPASSNTQSSQPTTQKKANTFQEYLQNKYNPKPTAPATPKAEDFQNAIPTYQAPEQIQRDTLANATPSEFAKEPKFDDPMSKYMQRRGLKELDEVINRKYGAGNIDLTDRDTNLYDEDGRLMTVNSMSFGEDGKEILIPTVVKKDGKWVHLTEDEAIDWYHKTGEYLGKFDTVDEADAYAQKLHEDQDEMYGDGNRMPDFMLSPFAKAPQSEKLSGMLNPQSNYAADVLGQTVRTSRAMAEAERKLPEVESQIEDVTNAIGMATTPEEKQVLDQRLTDLKRQRDELSQAGTNSRSVLDSIINRNNGPTELDAFDLAEQQQRQRQNEYNAVTQQVQDIENALASAYTPEQQDELRQQLIPLQEQKRAMEEEYGFKDERYAMARALQGSVYSGSDTVVGGVTNFLDSVFGEPAQEVWNMIGLGAHDNPITALNKFINEETEQNREFFAQETAGNKDAEAVYKYGQQVVAALPAAAMAYMTAGASEMGTAGLETAAYLNSLSGAERAIASVGNAVSSMTTDPNFLVSFMQEAGNSYKSAVDEGMSAKEASVYSMLYGYLSAIVEVGGTSEAAGGLQEYVKQAGGLKEYAKSIVSEMGEEMSQGMLERGLKSLFGQDTAVYSNTPGQNAIISPSEMAEEAKGAALVSAVLGAPNAIRSSNVNAETKAETPTETATPVEQQTQPQTTQAEQQTEPQTTPAQQALLDTIGDNISNSKAETIINDPVLKAEFEQAAGVEIKGTKSEQRAIVKSNAEAVTAALTGEEVTPTTETETPTTTTENNGTAQETETEQQEGINTPTEAETEESAVTPRQNTEETAPETQTVEETTEQPVKQKPRELTKSQQKVSDMLSQGEITDDVVQKIAKNDNYIKAVEDLTGTEFPKNQKAQAKFLQNLAQDLSTYGSPDAYLVAKMQQDNGIKTVQSELQYKIDQLSEEIKAAEMRGEADKVRALTEQKVNYERKIQQQKDILKKYKQQQKAKREAKKVKAVTEKINKLIKDLKNRAVRPTEGKYIPQGLQGAVADAMAAITESQAGGSILQTDKKLADLAEKLQNAKTADEAETYLKQWDSIVKKDERLQTNFGKVLDAVAEMRKTAENTNDVRPEILQDYVNSIASEIGDTPFYLMDSTQLGEVYNALKAINTLVNNTVNSKILGKMQLAYETAIELRNEARNARTLAEAREDGSWVGNAARAGVSAAELGFNRPQVVFNLMGGRHVDSAFNALYESFNEAYHDKIEMTVKGREYFNDLLDDSKGVRSMRDKVTVKGIVNSDGKEINMSRGMRLYLRMLLENSNSARSIALGGLTIPDTKAYYLGVNDNGFGTTRQRSVGTSEELNTLRHDYRQLAEKYNKLDSQTDRGLDWQTNIDDVVTQMDAIEDRINNILEENGQSVEDMKAAIDKDLTAYEKEWIAKAREFFDWAGGEVDAANLAEFGFNKATVENYVPMMRDANFRNSSVENIVRDMSIRNWGAMKTRSNFASQPLMLMDLFDVCDSYLQKSSIYAKVMPTINEFERIWNTVEATENESGNLESLRDTITDKFGKAGVKYIDNLVKDMQGGRGRSVSVLGVDVTGLSNALNRARGNLAKASLTMNPGVALGQTASLLSAGAKIPTRYILKALATPQNRSARDTTINEHTPMLKDRQQGSGSIIKADANVVDRAYNKMNWLTGWIQNMDSWTVSKLWQASEYYVQDQLGIDKDSEGYYETVTDTWEEILETTQPEYNPLQRPDVLRSPDTLVKSMTMFMTQRIQNYNTLFDSTANLEQAVHDVQEAKKSGDAEKIAQAQDALKTRGTEFARGVSSVVASSAAYVAIRALADGLMHRWDKFRDEDTGEITGEKILERAAWMFGETMAGCIPFGNMVFTALESSITGDNYYGINVNGISNISKAVEDIVGVGKAVFSDADKDKLLDKAHKAAKSLADMLGIPASNTEKLVQSALDWYGEIQNMVENDGVLGEFYDFSAKQNKNRLTDALENGDSDKAAKIMESMGENAEKYAKEAVKEAYSSGEFDTATAVDYLADLGINGARDTVFGWKDKAEYKEFQEENPDTSFNQTAYKRYEASDNKPEQEVFEKVVGDVTEQTGKAFGDVKQTELFDFLDNSDYTEEEKEQIWDTWMSDAANSYSGLKVQQTVKEAKAQKTSEYDSKGDNAAVQMLLGSDLDDAGKDEAMQYVGSSFRNDYNALRESDYSPDEIFNLIVDADALGKGDKKNNGSIDQKELTALYKKYPELEPLISTVWDARGFTGKTTKTWETYKKTLK